MMLLRCQPSVKNFMMKREKINFLLKKMPEVRKLYRNERIIYEKHYDAILFQNIPEEKFC